MDAREREGQLMRAPSSRDRVMTAVRDFIATHGYPPTMREIGAVTGMVPSTVSHHLQALELTGRIKRRGGIARGITVVDAGPAS